MMCTSSPWVFGASLSAAPYETPFPASRSSPSAESCLHETPHARTIVCACKTSPAVEEQLAGAGVDPLDRARDEDLCPEPPRLLERAARELIARDAGREPEIVLDAGRRSGLTAGRLALDHDRAEALRRAVHRRRQAGGAGADDHRVVLGCGRLCFEAEQLRDPTRLRPHDRFPVDDADHGAVAFRRQGPAPLLDRVRLVGLKPGERDLVPVEEAPQLRATKWTTVGIAASSSIDSRRGGFSSNTGAGGRGRTLGHLERFPPLAGPG